MAKEMTKGESELKKLHLAERLQDDDFVKLSLQQQADELGIARRTLCNWLPEMDWEMINKKRTRAVLYHKPKIDAAVMAKAKNGNISAAELAYKMIMGISEKHVNEVIARSGEDEDERKRREALSPEERLIEHVRSYAEGNPGFINTFINRLKLEFLSMNPRIGQVLDTGPLNLPVEYLAQELKAGNIPHDMDPSLFDPERMVREGVGSNRLELETVKDAEVVS